MLDIEPTRERFLAWVRSPEFDSQFNARFKATKWPFIAAAISALCAYLLRDHSAFLILALAPLFLLLHGYNLWLKRRTARKNAHLAYANHVPVFGALTIGNRALFTTKGAVAPALLVGSFEVQDDEILEKITPTAAILMGLYGEDPATVPPELKVACLLVNDDTYRPDRRRQVPADLVASDKLWLFDILLLADDLPVSLEEDAHLICMAAPGAGGTILQVPRGVPVFKEAPFDPNIIHHSARTTPPPLVAPHADNLEAVEKHISRHLGEPATVFHELVSTTVHIDVHFVQPTPERPWISLVTSGMSDIPMNAPEGAGEFRFAELMIRLPAGWKLSDEAFKQEENYWPIRTLKFLARFVHEYETWLSFGHTIPNGNPPAPLAPGLPFTGMILSPPWIGGDDLATLRLADGTPVHFWSLVPLHPSEMAFKLANGADALFKRLAAAGHSDLFDPRRPAVA